MAVESLLADVKAHGVGKRYLIQHSAGSGKSNSIAWLAHQLTGLEDAQGNLLVDSVIVVTDRVILDKQIRDNIRQFAQVGKLVAWAESSGDLRKAIEDGRRIIITTIEKFPYVLPEISEDHKDRAFCHHHRRSAFQPERQDRGQNEHDAFRHHGRPGYGQRG